MLLLTRLQRIRRALLLHGSQADRLTHPGCRAFKLASRFIARSSDALLVLTTAENAKWRTFEPRHYFTVLNPFVRGPELFAAAAEHALAATPARKGCSIIFVGRLIREKGAGDLLDAVRRVSALPMLARELDFPRGNLC